MKNLNFPTPLSYFTRAYSATEVMESLFLLLKRLGYAPAMLLDIVGTSFLSTYGAAAMTNRNIHSDK